MVNRTVDDIAAVYWRATSDPHVIVAGGYSIAIRTDRGRLIVSDGIGKFRRIREFSRIERALRRIVVLGDKGYVTLQAQQWCRDVGITLVNVDHDGHMVWSSVPDNENAKLMRAQALAGEGGSHSHVGLSIVKRLLGEKIREQASNLLLFLGDTATGDRVAAHAADVDDAGSVAECRYMEAQAASIYWRAWAGRVGFADDTTDWPGHWTTFAKRYRSLNGATTASSRGATDPINAMLNFSYKIAEMECQLACHATGLHPSLGFLHLDREGRDSLVFDLIETVRPHMERHILGLLGYGTRDQARVFGRKDFRERPDGTCRLLSPLTHELAERCIDWSAIAQPFATRIAQRLSAASSEGVEHESSQDGSQTTREDSRRFVGPSPADVISDDVWSKIAPLLSITRPVNGNGGRPYSDQRAVLAGIWIATTGSKSVASPANMDVVWSRIPASLGVSRHTCKRRYDEWCSNGLWPKMQRVLHS